MKRPKWVSFKPKGVVVAIASATALLLGACTGATGGQGSTSNPGSSSSGDLIEIEYWGFDGGTTSETAKKVIADFEAEHDNVKVNAVVMDTADFDVKLPSTLGTASGPDLVYTGTEPNHLGKYVIVDQVSSLDSVYAERGWDDQLPSTQERLTYNGEKWAVGNELETVGLMYNKKIFSDLNLDEPTTLSELETVMDQIIKDGDDITPMVLACGGPCYAGLHMMHALGYAMIPTEAVLDTTADGNSLYSENGWQNVLEKFDDWNKAGYFSANASGIPDENHWAEFCSGTTAMMVKGPWMFNAMTQCEEENPDRFEFGFTGFPVEEGLPFQAYVGTGKAWMVSESLQANPEKLQLTLDLISALTDESTFASWIETDQRFPAYKFDRSDYELTNPQQDALDIIDAAGVNGGAVDIGFNNSAAETDVWVSSLQGILTGDVTPQQAIANLDKQLSEDQSAWAASNGENE